MTFKEIRIHNFRNISSASVNTDAEDIVLEGINGQGKTNFLESVYALCYGSSFRTPHLKETVRHGCDGFSISAAFENEYEEIENIATSFNDGTRRISINENEIKDRKDLIYLFPCIAFIHDDIRFITGEPEERRKFFDQMMSLHSPHFFDILRQYRGVLRQRNAAIKAGQKEIIHLYDSRLAMYGFEIMGMRAEAVYGFNKIFPSLFSSVSRSSISVDIRYQPSWNGLSSPEEIKDFLISSEERDLKMMTTSSGIHRDRFTILSGDIPFHTIGSTGQIRLCSVLLRISEAIYFTRMTGKKPIMLIDDVLLELDREKRASLLSSLSGYSQAFYTFLPDENYFGEKRKNSIIYKVENGEFSRAR